MTAQASNKNLNSDMAWFHRPGGRITVVVLLTVAVLLRLIALDSDAYARLSWSSALLTDEGFYLHNARNLVLFGQARTDAFNNQLIMPLLHLLQVLLFRSVGVGLVQARLLSVGCSLLTLGLMYGGLRRAFGVRVACCGTLLLGLDHTNLLYNRLALMDTPAALFGVGAFWAWVRAQQAREEAPQQVHAGALWLVVCGALLGLGYTVRGLVALMWIVPLALLGWKRHLKREGEQGKRLEGQVWFPSLLWLGLGLAGVMGVYALVWWWPHRQELAHVDHYYIQGQLIPHSLGELRANIAHNLFGEERGFSPYLFRHTPVQFVLALLVLASWAVQRRIEISSEIGRSTAGFLAGWLLVMLGTFACIRYAPSRYYVLFYPALAGLAALAIADLRHVAGVVWKTRPARALLGGFFWFQLAEAVTHHQSDASDIAVGISAIGIMILLAAPIRWQIPAVMRSLSDRQMGGVALAVWAIINLAWIGDWLSHLSYTQRDADAWLARHLPADSVLIGDAAPGLCLRNRFVAVPVIPGLCNDRSPVEQFADRPRYIVILDGKRNEGWWHRHYPAIVAPDRRWYQFHHVVKFNVSVYRVPQKLTLNDAKRSNRT